MLNTDIYIGLGSNIGDKLMNLKQSLNEISRFATFEKVSSPYLSSPIGFSAQPSFINAVCKVSTELDCWRFLDRLNSIEEYVGRLRPFKNAPRLIDLDILLWGNMNISQPGLIIPHPEILKRRFVLDPLIELNPSIVNPATGKLFTEDCSYTVMETDLVRISW